MEDKIICVPQHENNDALIASLMNNNNGMWPMAAMMNGGMNGGNNMFAWIVLLAMMRWMGGYGDNGFCNNGIQSAEIQGQIDSLRTQMSDNHNSDLLMAGIRGSEGATRELANNLNCDFNALSNAICDVRSGIDRVAGQVGFSSERVINSVQLGDMNIITQLKDCCCSQKELIQRMGYENQLGQKDQMFATQNGFCNLTSMLQQNFAYTNTGIERGFSSVAYANQQQTCELTNTCNANTQRIIDVLNNHWNCELQQKYQDARLELSQQRQNAYLIDQLKTTTAAA